MSKTPIHTSSWGNTERRQHERRRVSAVAYLEIESSNGGIALDFSEDGMAFQAAGPLDGETSINLRIQLPGSRTRIKTTARIVWIRQKNRQAGVRFVDLPTEALAQIQEWIRLQNSLVNVTEGKARSLEAGSQTVRDPRKDKWRAKVKPNEQESPQQTPEQAEEAREKPAAELGVQAVVPTIPAPGELRVRATLPSAALWRKEVTQQSPHYQKSTEPVTSELHRHGNGQSSSSIPAAGLSREDDIGYHGPADPTISAPPPIAKEPQPVEPSPSPRTFAKPLHIDSGADLASVLPGTIPAFRRTPSTTPRENNSKKWVWIGASFGLFSIVCFGIGTLVGYLGNRSHAVQGSIAPTIAAPTVPGTVRTGIVQPVATANTVKTVRQLAPTTIKASHTELVKGNAAPGAQKGSLERIANSAPAAIPTKDAPLVPPTQTPTSVTAARPPGSALVPDDSSATASRMVAGQILKPSDRFNECYLTYRVQPTYPPEARQQRVEGAVKLHLVVGANGKVRNMQVLSGTPLLAPAAMEAAKFWQYLPALLNGQPVESEQDVEIDFHLPH